MSCTVANGRCKFHSCRAIVNQCLPCVEPYWQFTMWEDNGAIASN